MTRSTATTTCLTVLAAMSFGSSTTSAWTTVPQPLVSTRSTTQTIAPPFLNYKANSHGHEDLPIDHSGEPVTDNPGGTTLDEIKRKYIVDGDNPTNTMKSEVFRAQRKCEETGEAVGDQVVIKMSLNHNGMSRESDAYDALASDLFVAKHEFYRATHDKDASVIVMESGEIDLTKYINNNSPLSLEDVRSKVQTVVDILKVLHAKNVVWCDMKTCNFVVFKDGSIKGIDLESATFVGTPNYMHTGSGAPPEYAIEHVAGRNAAMELSFDIWSLGMVLYHFAVGEHYFTPRCELSDAPAIFAILNDSTQLDFTKLYSSYVDPRLRDLIVSCLQFDPVARPTIEQVQSHPFFDASVKSDQFELHNHSWHNQLGLKQKLAAVVPAEEQPAKKSDILHFTSKMDYA